MSGEFSPSKDFLAEHEPHVRELLDLVHDQLDHADDDRKNNGMLNIPINDVNIYAAKWEATPPVFPGHLKGLLPFEADDPVIVHARYRYGLWASMVNIWVSNAEGDFKSFSLGLRVDSLTGKVRDTGMNRASSNHTDAVTITEQDTRAVMDAIFAGNSAYQEATTFATVDLFKLGIATQSDYGAEQYTVEEAEKVLAVPSRTTNTVFCNGFDLKVRVIDRVHPNGKPSTTRVTLRQHFEAADYSPVAFYAGTLTKELIVEQDEHDQMTSIKRNSKVMLCNDPAVTKVNGQDTLVTVASDAGGDIPAELATRLYPDETPTLEDLAYFTRLVSQPINEADYYI